MSPQSNTNSPESSATGETWPAQHSRLAGSFELFCKTLFKIYCPLTVHGKKNLPTAPFVLCSNHASHLDSTMIMAATGISFKRIGLIAAKDYFFDQSHRFYLHYMMNLVPIARGVGARAIRDSIVACRSFLASDGQALIIYPEGTRSQTGRINKFKQGAAILAHDLDIPLVPTYVKGSIDSLPKGAYFLRPKKVAVEFGTPIKVSDWLAFDEINDRKATFHAYREATSELERQVRAMEIKWRDHK